jgi:hypothetical protein
MNRICRGHAALVVLLAGAGGKLAFLGTVESTEPLNNGITSWRRFGSKVVEEPAPNDLEPLFG